MGFGTREGYLPNLKLMKELFSPFLDMVVDTTNAQPGRVVLQSHSRGMLIIGEEYTNAYLFLFEFNEHNQLRRTREYFNMDRSRDIILPAAEKWRAF